MMRGSDKVHALCGEYPCSLLIPKDVVARIATVEAAVIAISEMVKLDRPIR